MNKKTLSAICCGMVMLTACQSSIKLKEAETAIYIPQLQEVKINDTFWTPKLSQWSTVTLNDVFDKFEGKFPNENNPDSAKIIREGWNAFQNFDDVAAGLSGTDKHNCLPWFDGLIYETIRGASDLLILYPNKEMEERIDGYIKRIAAAQAADSLGFIATYTTLRYPDQRWGFNGGFLRMQHDVYNAGMLIEAGIHYYDATGKTDLLNVAVRLANYMCDYMGAAPKKNVVPAHSGPEEPMFRLYQLFANNPSLKKQMDVPVDANAYYTLATYWLENRGNHCGMPNWGEMGNDQAEKWIKDNNYTDAKYGDHSRPTWGPYAQDSVPTFEQKTIEGHAVRATLFATGLAYAGIYNGDSRYLETTTNLWDNMAGHRMFVTGGVGAIAHDEKFGDDYFLPVDAYLETCAAVGAGFFSQRMNQLTADAKYYDEFERTLYNNVLTGISLDGTNYTYQNPLNAEHHHRWGWHDCPCCPPMFLKMVSFVPQTIYAWKDNTAYVNLFIGSETTLKLSSGAVKLTQSGNYPWEGKINIAVNPEKDGNFDLKVRIPGWATGNENPFGLYTSSVSTPVTLSVNGEVVDFTTEKGYATINRTWKKGDKVELNLPVEPRIVKAAPAVKDVEGMAVIAAGPIVYCVEDVNGNKLGDRKLDTKAPIGMSFNKELLGGVSTVVFSVVDAKGKSEFFEAVPYYASGNREKGCSYKVWIPTI